MTPSTFCGSTTSRWRSISMRQPSLSRRPSFPGWPCPGSPRCWLGRHPNRWLELGFGHLSRCFKTCGDGWSYIFLNPTVRTVNVALAVGLIGGGMIIPLGPVFAQDVLHVDGGDGFRAFMVALGIGVALGVVGLTVRQNRLHKEEVFVAAVFGAGACLFVATSMWTLSDQLCLSADSACARGRCMCWGSPCFRRAPRRNCEPGFSPGSSRW